ncbi:C-C motif chemokine 8-like [Notolabrus celidotus]|uniref:C-C motif chemokine 8-like n=1 Tax=Notolabrus celidotus TaxID=1203425 RepID=UPI00148F950D|nr:C-C motif chemokine 8-like [Notolabrus celidotus]
MSPVSPQQVLYTISMSPTSLIAVTAVLLCITLDLVGPASAANSMKALTCCTKFIKKPIPFERIRGYREISGTENCRIKAIIFYTKMRKEICAKRDDKWVDRALEFLSAKLKMMAKPVTDARGSPSQKRISSLNDGSETFSSTAETIPSSTDGLYW